MAIWQPPASWGWNPPTGEPGMGEYYQPPISGGGGYVAPPYVPPAVAPAPVIAAPTLPAVNGGYQHRPPTIEETGLTIEEQGQPIMDDSGRIVGYFPGASTGYTPVPQQVALPAVAGAAGVGIMRTLAALRLKLAMGTITKASILGFARKNKLSLAIVLGMIGMNAVAYVNAPDGKRRAKMGLINKRAWKTIKTAYRYKKQLNTAIKMMNKIAPPGTTRRAAKKVPAVIVETGPGGVKA